MKREVLQMPKKLDEEITQSLLRDIRITDKDKHDMWNNIEKELFPETKKTVKKKRTYRYLTSSIAVSAAAILFLTFQTQPGNALIDKMKSLFVPEKNVQVALEGQKEEVNMVLYQDNPITEQTDAIITTSERILPSDRTTTNQLAEYILYVDEERYQVHDNNDTKYITPKIPLDDKYPEVSMSISQNADKSSDEMIEELSKGLKNQYNNVSDIVPVDTPFPASMVRGISGSEWNSTITKYYAFDNKLGGSFIITLKYFLEAEEGHGARFHAMLNEFKIIGTE